MNKQKSVILSIALLSALSAGITADAREGLRLSTDPKLTEKAIEAQMKQSVSAKEVNFDNMLLQLPDENLIMQDANQFSWNEFVKKAGSRYSIWENFPENPSLN